MASFSFYDDLRTKSDPSHFTPLHGGNYVGRNLNRYNNPNNPYDENNGITICHMPAFMNWEDYRGVDNSNAVYSSSAGILMAIHHLNNGDGVIIDEVQDLDKKCPIRFTTEMFNTYSTIDSVKGLTDMVTRPTTTADSDSVENPNLYPQPCAIIGTTTSDRSIKLGIVTGVYDLLQVSASATSANLDNIDNYPLFSRTTPSDTDQAQMIVRYLNEELKVNTFAVVFLVDLEYSLSYTKGLQKYAAENGMEVLLVPIKLLTDPKPTVEQVMEQMKVLKDEKINYIISPIHTSHYPKIMTAAGNEGLAGEGNFWIYPGQLSKPIKFPSTSMLSKVSSGNAMFSIDISSDSRKESKHYNSFLKEWSKFGSDDDRLKYLNSKQPQTIKGVENETTKYHRKKEFFENSDDPSFYAVYNYEAVVGMGLAACKAASKAASNRSGANNVDATTSSLLTTWNGQNFDMMFSGKEHHTEFVNNKFVGPSGNVQFGPSTYSRNATSTFYSISNLLEVSAESNDSTRSFLGYKSVLYNATTGKWEKVKMDNGQEKQFVYADGTTKEPTEFKPSPENMNLISTGVRAFCLTLSIIIMILSIGFLVYSIKMKAKRVFKMAQPPFLVMICVGTLLMGVSIIPLSVDEGVTTNQLTLNASCSIFPWFFAIGFIVTFSALFSKLWRVNKIMAESRLLNRVKVTIFDVLVPFMVLLFCNAITLSVWMIVSPPEWNREALDLGKYGQVLSSQGSCHQSGDVAFFAPLIAVNGGALLLACYQAYIGRTATTEVNESKYIGMAMVCIFQSFFFGIPLIVISISDRSAYLFVTTSICFVICIATLLFIFIPKILNQRAVDQGKQKSIVADTGTSSHVSGLSGRATEYRRQKISMIKKPVTNVTTTSVVEESKEETKRHVVKFEGQSDDQSDDEVAKLAISEEQSSGDKDGHSQIVKDETDDKLALLA